MSHARLWSIAFAVLASGSINSFAEEKPREIPLKDIWAYQMPGTRDVRELEPDKFGEAVRNASSEEQLETLEMSHTSRILQALASTKPKRKRIQAFAVLGTGTDALQEARSVLSDGQKPRKSFPANSEISVVFFSRPFGYYVHIKKVQRQGNTIEIAYSFVPHRTKELTSHFALIPLGELLIGEFTTNVVQSPMDQALVAAGFKPPNLDAKSLVSGSFQFEIDKATDSQ